MANQPNEKNGSPDKEKLSFEEAMKELEGIVADLESGELTLDESLARYEAGVKLYRRCTELLEGAEKKVQLLLKDENGEFRTEDFEGQPIEEETSAS